MKDELGDRFKPIEREWRSRIPTDQFMIVRLDGKAFHTWTRGLNKPFDREMAYCMDVSTLTLCEQIQGALCGYTQSDEISIICGPGLREGSQTWFNGAVQKVVSVAASIVTAEFNRVWVSLNSGQGRGRTAQEVEGTERSAHFDARVFPLPDVASVADYLWWRQSDARRNAVSMLTEHHLGAKAVQGVGTADRIAMLAEAGIDLDQQNPRNINGGMVAPTMVPGSTSFVHKGTGEAMTAEFERKVFSATPADLMRNWFYDNHIHIYESGDTVASVV